ncbi:MAG: DciA family protein [Planctomycetota bacterium]|jgi:hypothetical protein
MNDLEFLVKTKKKHKAKYKEPVKLGDAITKFMSRVTPLADKYCTVEEYWNQSLPEEVKRHCRLGAVSGGLIEIIAESPSLLYELRLCSRQILKDLRINCPEAGIRKIKFVVGTR